jgi:ATP:ADP antiporter, AAA family
MRDRLRTLLQIDSGEESMVSMLLTQSIFLGIFIGAFDITAHSLLLSTFDEKMMARGYIVSAIAGIILMSLFSRFLTRLQFKNFAIINLIVVTILTFSLWYALIFSSVKWIKLIVFILFGPLNIMVLFGFWETASRLFTMIQGKRLFRLTETGLIVGIIIISFAIPAFVSLKFHSHSVLFISAFSVLIAAVIQSVIGTQFSLAVVEGKHPADKPENKKSLSAAFRYYPYIRTIAIFTALSVLTVFFIQYLFMAVTRKQYPDAENMAGFLGFFTGGMMILILVVKLVIFPYILRNFGLRTCLIISPVLIAVFTAIVIPAGLFMGYSPESTGGFLILFLLLAFSRLVSKSLREAIEFPSLKVIYHSVGKKIKSVIEPEFVGMANEISVFFSGLLLTALGLFSFIRLIHFSMILLIIAFIWIYVALRLFREYRKSIIREVETASGEESISDVPVENNTLNNRFSAYINFRVDYFSLISGDFSVLNRRRNSRYYEEIINYARSKRDINLIPVLKKAANNADLDEGIRQHSAEVVELLQKQLTSIKSDNKKITEAMKTLSGSRMPLTTEIFSLLRDNSVESKKMAVYMIGKFRITDLLSEVCGCLNNPGLAKEAYEVLKSFGPAAEDELIRYYLINSGNIKLSKIILQLLGKSCTRETVEFLFSRLWSNSRQLKDIVVKCLIDCKFRPSDEERQQLNQLVSEIIGSITWNLSAKVTLERENDSFLLDKINEEIKRLNTFLHNILSIAYNSGSVALIRENLAIGTFESVTYAHEMTDILVSDSIKPKLISLFDVIPDEEKVINLFQFYPGEIAVYKKLLEDIINRDYNLISLWTKACALRSIKSIESDEVAESVTALLFSPEELIQEEAANLIARLNSDLYKSASQRIPASTKARLDKIINGTSDKEDFLFEKVQSLSRYFGINTEDELLSLAGEMKYIKNFGSESQVFSDGFIIWPLTGFNAIREVYVVYNGETERFIRKYQGVQDLAFYLLPFNAVEEYHFQFPDRSFEILNYIDLNEK